MRAPKQTYSPAISERIAELLLAWKLPTLSRELVRRMIGAGYTDAVTLLAEVFELEASERSERRVERLLKASKLPPGKTFETLNKARVPRTVLAKIQQLNDGEFLDRAENVLVFGLTDPVTFCTSSSSNGFD